MKIKNLIKKAFPIIFVTIVALFQAISDQKDSEKLEVLEKRINELEDQKMSKFNLTKNNKKHYQRL